MSKLVKPCSKDIKEIDRIIGEVKNEGPFGRDGNPFPKNDNPKVTAGGEIVY